MESFWATNWFNVVTIFVLLGGWLVHYGISKQKNEQTIQAVNDLKRELKEEVEQLARGMTANTSAIATHAANSDIHITSMFAELLKLRHDFLIQQMNDCRSDIQRIESMLTRRE